TPPHEEGNRLAQKSSQKKQEVTILLHSYVDCRYSSNRRPEKTKNALRASPTTPSVTSYLSSQLRPHEKRKDAIPKLFIGNIPHASSDMELRQWVESRGFRVESVEVIYDRITGKSRGFGFVTLIDQTNVQTAVSVLNGRRMSGRVLTVNEET